MRRQPNSTLLKVRAEATRWEWEGLPSRMRRCSRSLPLVCGVQYGVQGGPQAAASGSEMSEMSVVNVVTSARAA